MLAPPIMVIVLQHTCSDRWVSQAMDHEGDAIHVALRKMLHEASRIALYDITKVACYLT